ncbi:helix-turn-helix transcriptional regulator [Novosphingobium sp. AAP93]|jgi:ArsR family transcriptional regulator, virulence genes transcriptional regulator|uniref:ArsR/SmtB family transcription factor n=1 Tax=Novosphingobium sp. AAP93 TaxID=1523427 RepID=UPI0006B8E15B|nr:metalloregulator ArsR/SmtB family transcription factor [Novosphingobium sp. AAP93]KPF79011.1 transcriptional regulator [Novosphingobium sp. AAP93]
MQIHPPLDHATFEANATAVASILRELANPHRLMVLCSLVEAGEMKVGDIAERIGLSQSALSQHLARLREEGLVAFTRDAQVLRYRIADARIEALLATLYQLYCTEE